MHPTDDQAILQDRKIAYVVTDRNLTVIKVNGPASILQNWSESWLGHPLLDLVPELMGSAGDAPPEPSRKLQPG